MWQPIRRQATATRVISGCPYYLVPGYGCYILPLNLISKAVSKPGSYIGSRGCALTASGEGVGCALIQGISTRIIAKDFKAGLKTAAIVAATVGASYGIGELAKVGSINGAARVGLHMLVGGASSRASGGSFWRGAASSFAANTLPQQMVEMAPQSWHSAMNGAMGHAMIGAMVGGTTAVITGGGTQGFVNGAMTGAMQQLFNHWAHEDAQKGAEKSGVRLGIHSNVPSDSDFTAGHAWISVTDADGNVTNYGLWPDEHPMTVDNGAGSDVRVGMENGQVAVASKYFDLTVDQNTRLNTFLSTSAEWGYTHTCADWARDAVNYSTGQRIDVDDWLGFETPRELSRSLGE
jgi:hypothetical protein